MGVLNQMMDVLPKHDEMPNRVRFERNQRVGLGSIPRGETDCDSIILESVQFPHEEVFQRCKGVKCDPGSHVLSLCSRGWEFH